ncbi:hypothetical protein BH11PSE13_BH11PSE13_19670 [soil metagenome]
MVCSPQRNKGGGRRPGDIRGGEYAVGAIPPRTPQPLGLSDRSEDAVHVDSIASGAAAIRCFDVAKK